ncbi:MAG: hypothetical protein AB7E61_02765 [Acholeplasmataceae bacterium]
MRKRSLLLVVALLAFVLVACNDDARQEDLSPYTVDGVFTAFDYDTHNGPMVDYVSVTIKDNKIESFFIDARQGITTQTAGSDTPDDLSDDTYTSSWNDLTKKELGDDYGMVLYGPATLEWYEQIQALETHFLQNGVSLDDLDSDGSTDVVSGVSITVNQYYTLALEALELAKTCKFQAISCVNGSHGAELYFASMTVNDGAFSALTVDVLQSAVSNENVFSWNEKTKQELGDDYGMVLYGPATLEWYEQANVIVDYITTNGWNSNLQSDSRGAGGSLDGSTPIDALASATIDTADFYIVFGQLFEQASNAFSN